MKEMLTAAELMLLAEELDKSLGGARIRKIHERQPERFTFRWEDRERTGSLLLALDSAFPRAVLIDDDAPAPPEPTPSAESLRALMQGGTIVAVESLRGERILRWTLKKIDEGVPMERRIYVELFGRSRNLIVTDAGDRVLFALREGGEKRPDLRVEGRYAPPARRNDPAPPAAAPFSWLDGPVPPGGLSAAIEAWARPREEAAGLEGVRQMAFSVLRKSMKKDRRLVENLQEDVRRASAAESIRRQAELLKQNLGAVAKGATEVPVTDWSGAEARTEIIPLDPAEAPADAVQRLFAEAKKMERAWAHASAELGRAEDRLASLEAAERSIGEAGDAAALDAAVARAREAGLLPKGPAPAAAATKPKPAKAEPRKPYRTFMSADGLEILVGRTSEDNDELTFRVARGNHLWLHVADYAGSHVVVRADGEVPEQTMLDAALLAAHFSQAPKGSKALVSWTRAKFVKKFKGAHAGQVQLAERKTIRIRPEADRLNRLLSQGKALRPEP